MFQYLSCGLFIISVVYSHKCWTVTLKDLPHHSKLSDILYYKNPKARLNSMIQVLSTREYHLRTSSKHLWIWVCEQPCVFCFTKKSIEKKDLISVTLKVTRSLTCNELLERDKRLDEDGLNFLNSRSYTWRKLSVWLHHDGFSRGNSEGLWFDSEL